jgi:RNA binding exosome subunit
MESYIRDFTSSIGNIVVTINVVCHKGFIELSTEDSLLWKKKGYYGNRIDMICQAVYKALTNEEVIHEFGIGKMNLDYHTQQMGSFKPNMYFYGRTMSFLVDEIWLLQERG